MTSRTLMAAGGLLALTGAAAAQAPQRGTPPDRSLTVQMQDAKGQSVGTVRIRQMEHGTVFIADLRNLPQGPHGFHIHERGACDPPGFQSAGGHYNPTWAEHGFDNPKGFHAGDLPNIHVTRQGTVMAEFHSTRLVLDREPGGQDQGRAGEDGPFTLLDDDGSAVMIHARGDDHQADPSGSTGERIACGVIKAP